jgi:hypothetical protein
MQIELGITREPSFVEEILWALGLRVLCSALIAYLGWLRYSSLFSTQHSTNVPLSNDITSRLQARVTCHFDIYLMEGIVTLVIASRLSIKPLPPVKLRMDIPTSLGGYIESLGVTDALISLACDHRRRKQDPSFRQRRMECFQRDIELSPRHHRAPKSNPSHLQRSS